MNNIKPSSQQEFLVIKKYIENGLGIEIGCGTNRVSSDILTLDHYPHTHTDMVWDCKTLPFKEKVFDFIFSSHCLEDFKPEEIKNVFLEWWRVIKDRGYMVLLLPDMETVVNGKTRYPRVGEKDGNPSHLCNVGKNFIKNLCEGLKYIIVQEDTIDHSKFFTVDIVIQKGVSNEDKENV